ncbi:hypothetical protein ACH5RR_038575 [Cinchona calisaya]|uniref:GIL1/IRKI C-terminal domain-containing protein n=1 Tax=Cinchona calisaya TaxID=153742 RepID=A0ABD2XVN0_9GENT
MNNSVATSSSSSSRPPLSPHFTPIEEGNEDEELSRSSFRETTPSDSTDPRYHPTPLHQNSTEKRRNTSKKLENHGEVARVDDVVRGISCNKCRPNTREKISVIRPVDNNSLPSPNGIFKSINIFSNLIKKSSPKSLSDEVQWKMAAAELSQKLIQATRKRDEAILEAAKLKYSMAELERKLNKLEIYCHNLKSGIEICANSNANATKVSKHQFIKFADGVGINGKVIEHFLVSISEARSSVRILTRALTLQLREMSSGNKVVYDRISLLLEPYEVKINLISRNPRGLLLYLEALLNNAFFEDFESIGFQKKATNSILNPIDRCEANFASFNQLRDLTWDEVLNKGTKHFSEDFSKFCDRKMSEIVSMLGWNRAWHEQLLQSFFGASKAVWLVHLLAHSVHPSLPIFRVDKGANFDSIYMEDMGGDKAQKLLVPTIVRIMVTPGFYVYDNVVKCKVLCRYYNSNNIDSSGKKVLVPSPS